MISEYLSSLHLRLKAGRPPNDLSLIQEVGSIDWRNINDEEVDLACEIILRVSADVIVCASDCVGTERDNYWSAFSIIRNVIQKSGLPLRSKEFKEYYRKYLYYLSDFNA
jgi:hypothetical protein